MDKNHDSFTKNGEREGTMKKNRLIVISLVLLLAVVGGYFGFKNWSSSSQQQNTSEKLKTETTKTTTATLAAIGDVLIHDRVYEKAYVGNQKYNFNPNLANVKELIGKADITMANQESMVGGVEIGITSYPTFNSPIEIGETLKDCGVDIVSIANNHTLDKGERGVLKATDNWDLLNMPYTGGFRSQDDRDTIRTIEKNGIKFSFLAYTYGTNGIPVPKGKDYLVNLIGDGSQIKTDITEARKISDVVVVSLHFGNEYQRQPNEEQKKLVNELAEHGADIIMGHHPHVLQPATWITRSNGEKVFVAYSLGNFISGQRWDYKDIGGIMSITVEKTVTGDQKKIQLKAPSFIPTFVNGQYHVSPLADVREKDTFYDKIEQHMKSLMPDLKVGY